MKGFLAVPVPSEARLGPAMRQLNERQQLFVVALFEQGRRSYTRAAEAAGYSGKPEVVRVQAHRLAHNDKVLAAIQEEGFRRMQAGAALAVDKLGHILENSVDDKTTLKAIEMTLNRVGLHARTEHINRNETITDDVDKIARIVKLCGVLGVDPKTMLGRLAPKVEELTGVAEEPIDVEFSEVDDATNLEGLI